MLLAMSLEYYTSERFIHDDIVEQAKAGLDVLRDVWREERKITPFLLIWPSEHLATDNGTLITHLVHMDLPEDDGQWPDLLRQAVRLTKAYGLLLGEQREGEIRVIVETPHGSVCWTIPTERHGDLDTLGPVRESVNTENLGYLWRMKRASA